ncbi:DUF11 domain-containing protein [Bacillus clarus]|uniref:DUF11 domain-containing protein n=1 Tax=Bacillus clarus TaxID=2338372 RepID=A0A090ZFG1_9BACI|nr:DUF11 domain-containing protein [Bacillus clarus]KFN02976.1 hypothetical protein DJ93_424 [Bacillus clarus]RFT66461.1 DUF11 domain-containing protein [Bacillus clarus]
MPFMNRFTTTVTGAVTFTGNTLGLSPTSPAPNNNFGTIDVFTTVNTSLQVPGFPVGTTNDWPLNSSSAILNLPVGSSVLYAELVWAGTYRTDTEDVTAFLNDDVTFTTPAGIFSVTPDPATAQQGSVGNQFYYVRSANVTSLVNGGGTGTYTTGRVPAARTAANPTISRSVGWTLEVIYQNASLPLRNLSVYAGQEIIDASSPPVDAVISGFATPATGMVTGRVLVTAQEGDSNIVGDQLRFGPNVTATVALFGPRNPANNFFQSQICNDTGNLDTTGTFGDLNQPLGIALPVRRQGWDITNVDASSSLVNNQTSATVRFVTNGDGYAAAGFGVQIDATGPIINPVKAVDKTTAGIGDILTYTITVPNTGTGNAENVVLQDSIPNGTTFVAGSVTVGGVTQPSANPATGINLGTIANNAQRIVTFQVRVTSFPNPNPIQNRAMVSYQFRPFVGSPLITSTASSNTVRTTINRANVSLQKAVDLQVANINDVLTYTVNVTNNGNVAANNVIFVDSIPGGTTFVAGSVTVNGISQPGANPANSMNLGSINASQTIVVRFQIRVTSNPLVNPIPNRASVTFNFIAVPGQQPMSGQATSNTVFTTINTADIRTRKTVDKSFATINDILTYTVTIENIGNTIATNVMFQDPIPLGTIFLPNSVTVDGISQSGANPETGFSIVNIPPGGTRTITFQVRIVSSSSGGTVTNRGNVTANFIVNPNQLPITINRQTNTVVTQINTGGLNVIKEVNTNQATVGDILTYTVTVQNTGNALLTNVFFQDVVSLAVSFVANSVTINKSAQNGLNPNSGFSLPNIPVGQSVVVSFEVLIELDPANEDILNSATVSASFQVNPNEPPVTITSPSNVVNTTLQTGGFEVTKFVNAEVATVGDILTYTIEVINAGSVAATNVQFIDVPSSNLEFVPDSVEIDGVSEAGLNPFIGFSLPDLVGGTSVLITFDVIVTAIPFSNSIMNTARTTGDFELVPGEPPFTIINSSNTTVTPVNRGSLDMVKEVDNLIVGVGDIVTYRVRILNTGTVDATNVQFIDVLSEGATFVPDSVTINGAPQPGLNPTTGFTILDIPVGDTVVVTYQATITSFPDGGTVENIAAASAEYILVPGEPPITVRDTSNTVVITVNTAILFIAKGANFEVAMVGDVVTYGIAVINDGTVPVTNIVLKDVIDSNTLFINGTVIVNDVPLPFADPNIGIPLGDFQTNDAAIINFQVVITGGQINNLVTNTAVVNGLATVNPNQPPVSIESDSNTVVIPFIAPNVSATVVKTADLQTATIGDVITYTTVVMNTGDVVMQNIRFQDMLDSSVQFISGSVTVDGASVQNVSPVSGFLVGNLNPGEERTISFKVAVEQAPNGSSSYVNKANIRFEHQLGTVLPPVTQMIESNRVDTPFVPTIEQICQTNLNCLDKIPFRCLPCNHLRITRRKL